MNVKIFYGGRSTFNTIIPKKHMSIVELALLSDSNRHKFKVEISDNTDDSSSNELKNDNERLEFENIVAFSDDYPALSESTIESFATFALQYDIKHLYLQNPSNSIVRSIQKIPNINCELIYQEYKKISMDLLKSIKENFSQVVIGQESAQMRILIALYNVAKYRYNKPCVMLFYGDTGVGKTESAKFIANSLNEPLFRKQFSMLHSDEFSSYVFGGKHNQSSLAKDLLDRESNVLLFDEFDKPHSVFHSAFYQLFDEGVYCDKNFEVKIEDAIIICTSNYKSEQEIKAALGEPIFSRFDAIVKFEKLDQNAIKKIMKNEFIKQYSLLDEEEKEIIDSNQIEDKLLTVCNQLSNARQIKKIIKEVFGASFIKELL